MEKRFSITEAVVNGIMEDVADGMFPTGTTVDIELEDERAEVLRKIEAGEATDDDLGALISVAQKYGIIIGMKAAFDLVEGN